MWLPRPETGAVRNWQLGAKTRAIVDESNELEDFEFQIDPASLSLVSQLSDTLSLSATERIRDEFLKMMTVNQSVPILEIMQDIGLLQQILKSDFEMAKKKISFFEQQPVPDQLDQYLQQAEGLSVED